ncbi:OmpA family protein [Hymenobacter psychrophilus]|uniref:Thrombospondin type 3 repeat-containing protein n=1 Tax=Hymenobacter psychrophilus TaxID=651662 RepID=A0A1H3FFZ1_9BACT|nr:OmpA family protein [Hymenobacter psychrophilus]SDX89911.1 Thrombospondin type 3 repeat-containing protein [Hymenobacter psychrophilus]
MKKILTSIAACGLAMLSLAPDALAQTSDRKTNISVYYNWLQYHGDLGSEWFKHDKVEYGLGLTVSRYIAPGLDIGLDLSYGDMKFSADYPKNIQFPIRRFDANVVNVGVPIKLKLNNGWALKEDAFIAPYLVVQPGVFFASPDLYDINDKVVGNSDVYAFDISAAAGIKFNFSESVGLFIQTGQHYPLTDQVDGITNEGKKNDRYLQHKLGLSFNLGKAKDTDGDGVSDRKDKCPDTPAGVAVDENGCPLDGDKDGVPDYQDQCPTEAGTAAMMGCPDRDNDGVADKDDECPDQAGLPALRGCPDADGDGVADKNDKCPDTPAGTQVDATGCPMVMDADGDGVADNLDKCPNTPAGTRVDANGCPMEVNPALRKLEQPIRFETNSTVIKRTSYGTLDKMVQALKDNPEYSIRVIGHADSRGTDEYNQGLSERRAGSVKRYFTGKALDPARIVTEGKGESAPAAPNTSAANMAKNRRVEFKFEFFIPNAPQM